jgi:nucleotide-binding universal stress UspA family protein
MKRILICSDGSNHAQVSCKYAAWLALRSGAAVDVLYVTDLRYFEIPLIADLGGSLGMQPYPAVLGQLQELERKKAEVVLDGARRILEDAGLAAGRVQTLHKTGLLVDCLTDHEQDADIVLLGKRGENAGFAGEHLGSTMERVVRASTRPCIVTPRDYSETKRMLLAYDGGPSSRRAVEFLANSDALKGLELHIVIVTGAINPDVALPHLREAEAIARGGGFAPVCQMLHGTPEEQISGYITANDVHLLVMGAYGHSRIRRLIIGSTTTDMVRTCHVPVLLMR